MIFITTPAAIDATSFITVEEFLLFQEQLINSPFCATKTEMIKKYAIAATDIINALEYEGHHYSNAQALEFPRYGLCDRKHVAIDEKTIPQQLKNATALQMIYMLENDLTSGYSDQLEDTVTGQSIGGYTFKTNRKPSKLIPNSVYGQLKLIGLNKSNVNWNHY